MKTIFLIAILAGVSPAHAQPYRNPYLVPQWGQAIYGVPAQAQPAPVIPNDLGPWGKGYSVVTETEHFHDVLGAIRGEEGPGNTRTIQKVVPNDLFGNPIDYDPLR